MFCFRYKKLLMPFSEGALDTGAADRLNKHLASCARCREELAAISAAAQTLRAAEIPAMEPSGDLWSRVRREIEPQAAPTPLRQVRSFQAASAMAAAAVLLFFVLIRPPFPEERAALNETVKRTAPGTIGKRAAKAPRRTPSPAVAPETVDERPVKALRPARRSVAAPRTPAKHDRAQVANRIAPLSRPAEPSPAPPRTVSYFAAKSKEANAPASGLGLEREALSMKLEFKGRVGDFAANSLGSVTAAPTTPAPVTANAKVGSYGVFNYCAPTMPPPGGPKQELGLDLAKDTATCYTYRAPVVGFKADSFDTTDKLAGLPPPQFGADVDNKLRVKAAGAPTTKKISGPLLCFGGAYFKAAPATTEEKARLPAQRDEYKRRLAKTPNDILTITALAETEQALGNKIAVVMWRKKLTELRPSDPSLWIALGSALESNSQRVQAAEAYRKALKLGLADAQTADVNERLKRVESAPAAPKPK